MLELLGVNSVLGLRVCGCTPELTAIVSSRRGDLEDVNDRVRIEADAIDEELRDVNASRRHVVGRTTEMRRAVGDIRQRERPDGVRTDVPRQLLTSLHRGQVGDVVRPDLVRVRIPVRALARVDRVEALADT